MITKNFKKTITFAMMLIFYLICLQPGAWAAQSAGAVPESDSDPMTEEVTQGALRIKTDGGIVESPLKHTDVAVDISGFIARVTVTQTFVNPTDEKIEAVYVFPLSHTSAVDSMTMVTGDRRIVGLIKRRDQARAIYEQALMQGRTASLLEQERPNIFTQSVGNIKPHDEVKIEISYVDVLKYDMGTYEFHFPMVVGPRYIPGAPISRKSILPDALKGKVGEVPGPAYGPDPKGTGWAPDTDRVPDASRITPPVLKPGFRTGHDIALSLQMDAGVPIQDIRIVNHEAELSRIGKSGAAVTLSSRDSIPNKDFVLRYSVVGEKPEMAVLAHSRGKDQGYFLLMIQPALDKELAEAPPREVVFLIDVSGSMSGRPTDKVKEAMQEFFRLSKPQDTFQVITFASQANKLFSRPVPATRENISKALNFTREIRGGGGTEMLKGIKMVLNEPVDPDRVRIAVMLTDGYIGNEAEIIEEVGRRAGDQVRFWTIGIGSSPNRFLLDGVAKQGGGMSGVIELGTDPAELIGKIVERIHRAQLAKIEIDWKGLSVYETYPRKVPELWAGRPVILLGRYRHGGTETIELSGVAEGKPVSYGLDVSLPDHEPSHEVLSKVWARNKIEDLSAQIYYGDSPEVVEAITEIALEYALMSRYTSFVAVDESEAADITGPARPPRRMVVPVPLPDGVSFEGIFGPQGEGEEYDGYSVDRVGSLSIGGKDEALRKRRVPGRGLAYPAAAPMGRYQIKAKQDAGTMQRVLRPESRRNMPVLSQSHGIAAKPGSAEVFEEALEVKDSRLLHGQWTSALFRNRAASRHEEAKKALSEAQELQEKQELEASLLRCQHAFLLERAFLFANPYEDDGTEAAMIEALMALNQEISDQNTKEHPGLTKRLNLVIRNQSLEQAIEDVVKGSGLKMRILPGSLKDASEMKNGSDLKITYMDLGGATVAQALDWITMPNHLRWSVNKKTVTIGTTRRMPGNAPWVYVVGDLVYPQVKEKGGDDPDKELAASLKDLLHGVRTVMHQTDDSGLHAGSAVLMDPAELLVYGDREDHAAVSDLLKALKDAREDIAKAAGAGLSQNDLQRLRELQQQTSLRWAARSKMRESRRDTAGKRHMADSLEKFSWQLLAGSTRGRIDREALTELQAAWSSPLFSKAAEAAGSWTVLRSAWVITEAARTFPVDPELKSLARKALRTAEGELPGLVQRLKQAPEDQAAYFRALYAVLCVRNAHDLKVKVKSGTPSLTEEAGKALMAPAKDSQLSAVRTLAAELLAPSIKTGKALSEILSAGQIRGNDRVALAGLAASKGNGKAWKIFREECPQITGTQPLNGHVVVMVNELGGK